MASSKSNVALGLVAAAVFSFSGVRAEPNAPAPHQQERLFSPPELRSDLDAMYRGLQSGAFDLFAFTRKPEFDRKYKEIRDGLDRPMTLFEAKIRFQLLAATAKMGHARVDSPLGDWSKYQDQGGRAFPLNIRVVGGRAYVAENLGDSADIQLGDEILEIDSIPMSVWLARTGRHISAETPSMINSILEFDFPTYLWVEIGAKNSFDVRIKRSDGTEHSASIAGRTRSEMDTSRKLQPPVLDLEHPLRDARVLPGDVGYLRPGPFYNAEAKTGADEWDVSGFRTFIDAAFNRFNSAGVRSVIIDLRGNPGGDSLFSDVMIAWFADHPFRFFSKFQIRVSAEAIAANEDRIEHDAAAAGPVSQQYRQLYSHAKPGDIVDFDLPLAQPRTKGRFTGKVFALIDRQSYSNTVAVAATIQDYKFGTVLGEQTSDMATTFGAMEKFTLPVTGLFVGFPKARIVRPNGDLRSRGVTPDIAIQIPIVQSPADDVLQRARAIAEGGS